MKSFWEIRILLAESNEQRIRNIEQAFSKSRLKHFLRWVRTKEDLDFELRFNPPDMLLCGRHLKQTNALEIMRMMDAYQLNIPCIVVCKARQPEMDTQLALAGVYEIFEETELAHVIKEIGFIQEQLMEIKNVV
jgi:DNA-binding NtrC family response regulator